MKQRQLIIIGITIVIIACIWVMLKNIPNQNTSSNQSQTFSSNSIDTNKYSTDKPGSLWWIVNKKRALPSGYTPPDLLTPNVTLRLGGGSEEMYISQQLNKSLVELFTDAQKSGFRLMLVSGYRSEALQSKIYNNYIAQQGQVEADRFSAKPGTSEHQTGLALDIGRSDRKCELEQCFGSTEEGKWIANHAPEYGFIVRYPKNKSSVTGYDYEPWHLRYVGKELAIELYKNSKTMEEFFSL